MIVCPKIPLVDSDGYEMIYVNIATYYSLKCLLHGNVAVNHQDNMHSYILLA